LRGREGLISKRFPRGVVIILICLLTDLGAVPAQNHVSSELCSKVAKKYEKQHTGEAREKELESYSRGNFIRAIY